MLTIKEKCPQISLGDQFYSNTSFKNFIDSSVGQTLYKNAPPNIAQELHYLINASGYPGLVFLQAKDSFKISFEDLNKKFMPKGKYVLKTAQFKKIKEIPSYKFLIDQKLSIEQASNYYFLETSSAFTSEAVLEF